MDNKRKFTHNGSDFCVDDQGKNTKLKIGDDLEVDELLCDESSCFLDDTEEDAVRDKEPVATVVSDHPDMCPTYADSIYDYLYRLESKPKRKPEPDYIEKIQKDITDAMRGSLVNWLVEETEKYTLLSDTLYLTVSYLDRYLSLKKLNHDRLSLLGVSCMFIASKVEQGEPFSKDFTPFDKQEVLKMEWDILHLFDFELGDPTVITFLRRFTRTAQDNCQSHNLQLEFLGCYLAELSLLDYACISFLPSKVAASAIFLANFTIQPDTPPWNPTLQQQSKYSPSDLKDCVSAIHDLQLNRKGSSLTAIRNKYKHEKFNCVAELKSHSEIPNEFFEDGTVRLQVPNDFST